ncbi:ABC transporter ATP-binding protein [Cellulomonas sp. zg-ZUI222]|uniref:ABC transporter ATP-binding protein n=1 Tax=Cellulomonas TaxID=1707 RepID=UPI001A9523A6|nr:MULTISPECIES: ABC transporter ATP-binding protein [Cellulomonas]MBO0898973.1 ABC transporter ATP-binding protein [Cellulomonas sp. zg-ZUI22]MBO0919825.1 ABC transporter ATP-binding protein [Cellulomonas wangleii]
MGEDVLTVRGLRKRYRGRRGVQANDGIDLDVAAGQVVGLLGHNGAGKTTLVHQVVGIVRPDAGTITVAGADAVAHPDQARRLVSIQAQANVPISGLTPRRAIELVGRIRGASPADVRRRADDLLDALDLRPWADTPAEKVSGGVARLTAFAMTTVVPGRLVVLDEPTNDVDPVRRRLLWEQIRGLADAGHGVLLVTHNVREAERVVDHLAVLDRGVVLAADTPAGLTAHRRGSLTLEVDTVPGVDVRWHPAAADRTAGHLRATATVPSDAAADVVRWAQAEVEAGRLERYALTPASLEDVYVQLVGEPAGTTEEVPAA